MFKEITNCPRNAKECCNHSNPDLCCGGGHEGPCTCTTCHASVPSNLPTLLERLREDVMRTLHTDVIVSVDCSDAAAEIERLNAALTACQTHDYRTIIEESDRLRAALEKIANPDGRFEGEGECAAIARTALGFETPLKYSVMPADEKAAVQEAVREGRITFPESIP